jgi:hypothetical protein
MACKANPLSRLFSTCKLEINYRGAPLRVGPQLSELHEQRLPRRDF